METKEISAGGFLQPVIDREHQAILEKGLSVSTNPRGIRPVEDNSDDIYRAIVELFKENAPICSEKEGGQVELSSAKVVVEIVVLRDIL